MGGTTIKHTRPENMWPEMTFRPFGVKQPSLTKVNNFDGNGSGAIVAMFEVRGFGVGDASKRSCDDKASTMVAYRIKIIGQAGWRSTTRMLTRFKVF